MSVIPLRCEGPLQSWGVTGRHGYRDTLRWPTLSGVVGMIASASGIGRGDTTALRSLTERVVGMTVRVDRHGGLLEDYQTIGGGNVPANATLAFDKAVDVAPYAAPRRKGGSASGGTLVTKRAFITDASFLVLLRVHDDPTDIVDALHRPKWSVHLGRRTCVPAVRVTQHLATLWPTANDALSGVEVADRHDMMFTVVTDDPDVTVPATAIRQAINDVPHSFAHKQRRYGTRMVQTFQMPAPTADAESHPHEPVVVVSSGAPFDAFAAASED